METQSPAAPEMTGSPQVAVPSHSWRGMLSRFCLLWGAALLLSCALALVGSAVCFWIHLGLPKLIWPCAWLATVTIIAWNPRKVATCVPPAGRLAALTLAAATWIASLWMAGKFYDISYDGQLYHQEYILQLANGWNPFRAEFVGYRLPKYVWADSYSLGSEILSAGLFKLVGGIEFGKAVHGCFMISSFLLAFAGLLEMRSLRIELAFVLSLLCALNPISVTQSLSYYVDGDLASLIVCLAGLALVLVRRFEKSSLVLWAIVLILIVNVKLSGLVYGGFTVALACAALVFQGRWKSSGLAALVATIAIVLGTCFVAFKPYVTNTRNYGHPFYPFYGPHAAESGMRVLLKDNMPKEFVDRSVWQCVFLSIFSRTENAFAANPAGPRTIYLKNPFTVDAQECQEIAITSVRVGGWGPLFGAAVVFSVLVMIMALPVAGRQTWWAALVLAPVVFTTITNDYGWWARYTPQFYLVPVVVIVLAAHTKNGWIWAAGLCTLGILVANSWIVTNYYIRAQVAATQSVQQQLAVLAGERSLPIICFVEGFPSNRQRLSEMGVRYTEVAEPRLLPCTAPVFIPYSPTRFCDGRE